MYVLLNSACREVVYDHYVLALTWPTEFCSENFCTRNWNSNWNSHSLVIHGFWPSSTDLAYLSCLSSFGHDPYCNKNYAYNEYQFTSKEMNELLHYWPKLTSNVWSHEWTKHGTCYLHIQTNINHSPESPAQIFKSYFLQTINLLKSLNISLTPMTIQSRSELSNILKIKSSQFYAICGRDSELDEIRICYSMNGKAGKETLKDCPINRDRNQCRFPIVIK